MAKANEQPALDVIAGAAALDEDLPRVLRLMEADSIEELGWTRLNRITLLIPMSGVHQDKKDDYLLRLGFQAYRKWPPSAQFVNPETLGYAHPKDQHFVPRLTSPECHTHCAYNNPRGGTLQLICCSATLEFYEVLHGVKPEHVWRESETFFSTLAAIQKAMTSFYVGRFPAHGQ